MWTEALYQTVKRFHVRVFVDLDLLELTNVLRRNREREDLQSVWLVVVGHRRISFILPVKYASCKICVYVRKRVKSRVYHLPAVMLKVLKYDKR